MANVWQGKLLNNVDYNRLNLDNVERVEIVKGAASTLYGSSAVGGVINIITRDSEDPWNLNVNSRFGEHNDQRYGGTFSFKAGKFNSQTNVQHTMSDSYDVPEGDVTTIIRKIRQHWVRCEMNVLFTDRLNS